LLKGIDLYFILFPVAAKGIMDLLMVYYRRLQEFGVTRTTGKIRKVWKVWILFILGIPSSSLQ
jgi:hypothetical protein